MSYLNTAIYPDGVDAPNTNFPQGKPKNATSDAATDGWPYDEKKQSDIEAYLQGLMLRAGISPNGLGDNAINTQYVDALLNQTGLIVDLPSSMNNNKFLRINQVVKTRGSSNVEDKISRHYLIRLTASVPVPSSDDLVLTGDSGSFTAVFVGEVLVKRVVDVPFNNPTGGTWSGAIKAQLVNNVVHVSGTLFYSGSDILAIGDLSVGTLPAGYGSVGHIGGARGMSVYKATSAQGMVSASVTGTSFTIRPTSTTVDGDQFYFNFSFIRDVS